MSRILVTGAAGSVGQALLAALRGHEVAAHDEDTMDVRVPSAVAAAYRAHRPSLVYHLAAVKYAPDAEIDPVRAAQVNVGGTVHVVRQAELCGAHVVTASTCKACDPETVYGATKLIAERVTLAAGGSVARFYNVPESSGNVFALWRALPPHEPIPVAPCTRYFMPLEAAVALLLRAAALPPGLYTSDPGSARQMHEVAREIYPHRATAAVPPRRGDRLVEPRHAASERLVPLGGGVEQVESVHARAAAYAP